MIELSLISMTVLISFAWFCSHPLILCLILVMAALSVGVISGLIFMKWMTYAIFLIFLGGMMIVFIYITTLAGNEKFFLNFASTKRFSWLILMILFFFIPLLSHSLMKKEFFMAHMFFTPATPLLFFLVVFLFAALFVVVKLAESFKGALVKFF